MNKAKRLETYMHGIVSDRRRPPHRKGEARNLLVLLNGSNHQMLPRNPIKLCLNRKAPNITVHLLEGNTL